MQKVVTVKQLSEIYPCFNEAAIRYRIVHCRKNGLASSLLKVGKRVFVDVQKFDKWLTSQKIQ